MKNALFICTLLLCMPMVVGLPPMEHVNVADLAKNPDAKAHLLTHLRDHGHFGGAAKFGKKGLSTDYPDFFAKTDGTLYNDNEYEGIVDNITGLDLQPAEQNNNCFFFNGDLPKNVCGVKFKNMPEHRRESVTCKNAEEFILENRIAASLANGKKIDDFTGKNKAIAHRVLEWQPCLTDKVTLRVVRDSNGEVRYNTAYPYAPNLQSDD